MFLFPEIYFESHVILWVGALLFDIYFDILIGDFLYFLLCFLSNSLCSSYHFDLYLWNFQLAYIILAA